jgi:hypothetical protein
MTGRGIASCVVAALAACGQPVPEDSSLRAAEPARAELPVAVSARCEAQDDLGGSLGAWLPGDLRLAALVDLESPDLPAAITHVQAGVQAGHGLPVVASLGLGQLGLQLGILRPQLISAGAAAETDLAAARSRRGGGVGAAGALRSPRVAGHAGGKLVAAGAHAERGLGRRGERGALCVRRRVPLGGPDRPGAARDGALVASLARGWAACDGAGGLVRAGAWSEPRRAADRADPRGPERAFAAGRQRGGAPPLVRTLRASAAGLEIDGVMTGA